MMYIDLRCKVYGASIIAKEDNKGCSSESFSTDNVSHFIGWDEATSTLSVRSAFNQNNDIISKEWVEAIINKDEINIKTGRSDTTFDNKVTMEGTKTKNSIELAAKIYASKWNANIGSQTAAIEAKAIIEIQMRATPTGTAGAYQMRVDFSQCETNNKTTCSTAATTGIQYYNFKLSELNYSDRL